MKGVYDSRNTIDEKWVYEDRWVYLGEVRVVSPTWEKEGAKRPGF